jgi:antirestriction protein ArdC
VSAPYRNRSVRATRPAALTRDLYQEVTDTIVAALERGVAPWVPGHDAARAGTAGPFAPPRNGLTGRAYSGVNVLLLWLAAQEKGYASPAWYTFNQACGASGLRKDRTGHWVPEPSKGVRKGERATLVTFWKEFTVEDPETGEPRRVPLLRHFCVFNRAQIDGLPPETTAVSADAPEWAPVEAAERVVTESGVRVVEGGRMPSYDRVADAIAMPTRAAYRAPEAYYVDLLHELTHWTGHPARLARPFGDRFGSPEYAAEELVAELGAAFLCASLGIVGKLQHPEYVAAWIKRLRDDKREIFHAASHARQGCAYLAGLSPTLAAASTAPARDAVDVDDPATDRQASDAP